MNLQRVSTELSRRLISIFPRLNGQRWQDLVLSYEYFHGDNGAGIGASHQTGWTGLIARLIQITRDGMLEFSDKPADIER